MAASFIRLASDAPEKPVVRLATMPRSSSSASGLPRACTCATGGRGEQVSGGRASERMERR
eukprot:2697097-Prymnesium_polylepis.1